MRIINASGTDTIVLGYPGEHERTKVRFYYGDIKSEFPEGTLMLQVRRPGENTKYEVELEPDGYYAYWLVSDYDLVNEGTGECQLIYATTTAVSKKKVWKTQVEKGIKGKNIGIPPTWESIETRLLTAATTLQATIDETEERLDAAEERMDLVEQDVASAQQAATNAASSATEAVATAQQAIVDIQDATAAGVDTVNAEVIKAEGWAEGTQNGQPADEYADKSAKHWAEQASSSAADSASSASSAAASQASAASSESNAETYMRGAEQHKIGAETAAAEAESSATDAETAMAAAQSAQAAAEASKDSAAEFYDEVAASVSEAQRAEQEAEVAANDAEANALIAEGWAQGTQNGVPVADGEYYQNNAEYWAGIASDKAARTDTLAAEALRSMQAAGVSETNAASYAAAANTSANNANASAVQAYQSEQNAALSQVNAQNSQSAARVSAENAARSESAAAGSASTAEAAVNRYNNMSAVATTLEAEEEATASIDHSGSAPVLRLGIPKGNVGKQGEPGPQGVTFTPSVDAEGNLSWTNNGNVPNPPTVNIKGRPGEPGTSVEVHICGAAEYDENGVPTVENPDVNTFYLVPDANVDGQDMFVEWVNVDGSWEIFGSARVDLSNYVQKTDYATADEAGVVFAPGIYGITVNPSGKLVISMADLSAIKSSSGNPYNYKPIVPAHQHESTFYGLAKAAGDTTQSQSDNVVGTYTDEAKAAIQQMLDVPSNSDIPDVSIYATKADTVLETTLSRGRKEGTTIGEGSFAFGNNVEASKKYSHAEGQETVASGAYSHVEGYRTTTSKNYAHAEGSNTTASGASSHAEGADSIASGSAAHVEGRSNIASGQNSHVEGQGSIATGMNSHTEGFENIGHGQNVHVEGMYNVEDILHPVWESNIEYQVGDKIIYNNFPYECIIANSDAEFDSTKWKNIVQNNNFAHIVGNGKYDARSNAYALDWSGNGHYMGDVYVGANADSSGGEKLARESEVLFEKGIGVGSIKTKNFVFGGITFSNEANGLVSYAEGLYTISSGQDSHAEGYATKALGNHSHAEGLGTIASGVDLHVSGTYNVDDSYEDLPEWESGVSYSIGDKVKVMTNNDDGTTKTTGYICKTANSDIIFTKSNWSVTPKLNYAEIIGNGTGTGSKRSNAYALEWTGTGRYMGDVYVGCNNDSTGGIRLATVTELAAKLDVAEAGLKVVRLI